METDDGESVAIPPSYEDWKKSITEQRIMQCLLEGMEGERDHEVKAKAKRRKAQSELLDKGLVKNFQFIPATGDSLDHITAEVQGSTEVPYKVRINFCALGEIGDSECDCGDARKSLGRCKHFASVMLFCIRGSDGTSAVPPPANAEAGAHAGGAASSRQKRDKAAANKPDKASSSNGPAEQDKALAKSDVRGGGGGGGGGSGGATAAASNIPPGAAAAAAALSDTSAVSTSSAAAPAVPITTAQGGAPAGTGKRILPSFLKKIAADPKGGGSSKRKRKKDDDDDEGDEDVGQGKESGGGKGKSGGKAKTKDKEGKGEVAEKKVAASKDDKARATSKRKANPAGHVEVESDGGLEGSEDAANKVIVEMRSQEAARRKIADVKQGADRSLNLVPVWADPSTADEAKEADSILDKMKTGAAAAIRAKNQVTQGDTGASGPGPGPGSASTAPGGGGGCGNSGGGGGSSGGGGGGGGDEDKSGRPSIHDFLNKDKSSSSVSGGGYTSLARAFGADKGKHDAVAEPESTGGSSGKAEEQEPEEEHLLFQPIPFGKGNKGAGPAGKGAASGAGGSSSASVSGAKDGTGDAKKPASKKSKLFDLSKFGIL